MALTAIYRDSEYPQSLIDEFHALNLVCVDTLCLCEHTPNVYCIFCYIDFTTPFPGEGPVVCADWGLIEAPKEALVSINAYLLWAATLPKAVHS
jgi:hypothetical protein